MGWHDRLLPAFVSGAVAAIATWSLTRRAARRDLHDALAHELRELRSAIAELRAGRADGQAAVDGAPGAAHAAAPGREAPGEEITPEVLAILSAAVAAFLGKRARIRSARRVRVTEPNPWGVLGRVTVQTSHTSRPPR